MMPKRRTAKRQPVFRLNLKDDEWIRQHFEELVDRYAGQYILVAGGEVFAGNDVRRLEAKARRKYPRVTPIGMPVPRPEDFQCAL